VFVYALQLSGKNCLEGLEKLDESGKFVILNL